MGDIRYVVNTFRERYLDASFFVIGWSFGVNILMNFFGEEGENVKVIGVVVLCNLFDLNVCDIVFESGFFGKVYS